MLFFLGLEKHAILKPAETSALQVKLIVITTEMD